MGYHNSEIQKRSSRFELLRSVIDLIFFGFPFVHPFSLELFLDNFGVQSVRVSNFFLQKRQTPWTFKREDKKKKKSGLFNHEQSIISPPVPNFTIKATPVKYEELTRKLSTSENAEEGLLRLTSGAKINFPSLESESSVRSLFIRSNIKMTQEASPNLANAMVYLPLKEIWT